VRNARAEVSAWNQDSRRFAQREIEIIDDLQHVVGNDDIEGSIRNGKRRPSAIAYRWLVDPAAFAAARRLLAGSTATTV
jgi:hypothetical protein